MIKKYIDTYIAHCQKLCTKPEDYSKSNTRQHNKAMDALEKYAAEWSKTPDLAQNVFAQLLLHESTAVRLNAAAACLKYDICVESAIKVLEAIEVGEDRLSAFSAAMTLSVWRGELPGKKL